MIDHQLDLPRSGTWAGMGTGKTAAMLATIQGEQIAIDNRPALVLAPLRVAQSTWPDEAAKWERFSGMAVRPIVGDVGQRKAALRDQHAAVFTINYENLPWLIETLDGCWPFGRVVADESTRLKSFRLGGSGGRRARAIAKVAHKTPRWTNLTGTPSPNGLLDLWGQTWFLDAGQRLGRTYSAFQDRWFRLGRDGYTIEPMPFADAQIHDAVRDLHLTIDPADWFDIEKPIYKTVEVRLPAKARRHYEELEKEFFTELREHEIEAANAAVKSGKLLQMASGAIYTDDESNWTELHDAKLQALESIVAEANGMPILVAYHWRHDLARLQQAFKKGRHLDKDPQTIRDWNAGKIPILFAHPASAGHGLSLQDGGNIIAFFSHWWSMEEREQIIERIGPMRQMQAGYNRPVWVYDIIAKDTADELVQVRHFEKRSVQDILLEACKRP